MEDQEQDDGEQQHGTGSGPPKEPERTEEQLAWIHAAMMEELGVGRKDALVSSPRLWISIFSILVVRDPRLSLHTRSKF